MQKKPYIGKWISVLYRYGQSYCDERFEELGLGIGCGHLAFLMSLYRQEGVSQEELSREINIDKATTTRAIAKLQQLGYVVRLAKPTDKRAYRIFLTDKARRIEAEIRSVLKDWADQTTLGFSPEEKNAAYQLLERMTVNAIRLKAERSGMYEHEN